MVDINKVNSSLQRILVLFVLCTSLVTSQEEPSETCTRIEKIIDDHVTKIPFLIDKALTTAQDKLRKNVKRQHSYGYALAFSLLLDVGGNAWVFGRTPGNIWGTDPSRFDNIFSDLNNFGSNSADAVAFFFGLDHPEFLDQCNSRPRDFYRALDYWRVLTPETMSAEDAILNFTAFSNLINTDMACMLRFGDQFIEIARVRWALSNFFKALEVRLVNCVLDSLSIKKHKRLKKRQSEGFRRK